MEQAYRTIDGQFFRDAQIAAEHEEQVLSQVKMWNWNKEPTIDTAQAALIHLSGDGAGALFRAMVDANDIEYDTVSPEDIDDEDTGWFYWDEFADHYRYIDEQIANIIIAANHQI